LFSVRETVMSSSKVFKQDSLFTPMPLVQHTLASRGSAGATPGNDVPHHSLSSASSPPPQAKSEAPQQTPPIDLQALKNVAYQQGKTDQAAQSLAECQQSLNAFAEACQKIDSHRRMLFERSQGDLINIIIAFSKKILGHELTLSRNSIATTLQAAIEQAIESEEFYVTLHPDDLAFAEGKVPELIAAIRGLERIIFKTDKTVTQGGCLLESTNCSVDATIETQLESMKEFLEEQPGLLPAPEME